MKLPKNLENLLSEKAKEELKNKEEADKKHIIFNEELLAKNEDEKVLLEDEEDDLDELIDNLDQCKKKKEFRTDTVSMNYKKAELNNSYKGTVIKGMKLKSQSKNKK